MKSQCKKVCGIDRIIGNRIYKLRKAAKMSRRQVGELLGITEPQVRKYEDGVSQLTVAKLFILAQAFNRSMNYFMGELE